MRLHADEIINKCLTQNKEMCQKRRGVKALSLNKMKACGGRVPNNMQV